MTLEESLRQKGVDWLGGTVAMLAAGTLFGMSIVFAKLLRKRPITTFVLMPVLVWILSVRVAIGSIHPELWFPWYLTLLLLTTFGFFEGLDTNKKHRTTFDDP